MNTYLIIVLLFIVGSFLLDTVVELLNIRHINPQLPKEFEGYYDSEKYQKSQEYLIENTRFGLLSNFISTPLTLAFILLGGFNVIDLWARGFGQGSIVTGLLFCLALLMLSQVMSLPFSLYRTFVIEEKYGFNKTTAKTFIVDLVKGLLLTLTLGSLVLSGVLWFFEQSGAMAWLYVWLALTLLQLVLMVVAPIWIMPLFNKFEDIEEGELKDKLESYAKEQNFQMKGVYKMDGSKRSTKSNAYFTGFGKFRRIVLFDTLIEKHSVDGLVSILAHEMGHNKKGHISKMLATSICTSGVTFFIMSRFIGHEGIFEAFGMENISIYASLIFFSFFYTPIEMILSVGSSLISRKHEFEADAFAVQTYGKPLDMIEALKKLSVDNLSNLAPHPLKVFLSYSHPPVLERIKAIRELGDFPKSLPQN